jgi:putative flippase GtrA
MIDFIKKHKEIILYLIVGGLTTVVNIASYFVFANVCGIPTVWSNILAWAVSVIFAFVTNKLIVFESRSKKASRLIYEIVTFFLARVFSGVLDTFVVWLFVDHLGFNSNIEELIVKIASNVIVIIINYILSKLIIFRKSKKK